MAGNLPPYQAYRDSGQLWLGEVPKHWRVTRNKLVLSEVEHRSKTGTEELLSVSSNTGVTRTRDRGSGEGGLVSRSASLVGYKRVLPGDLVINIMLAWNGSLGVSSMDGIVSPAYSVFRPSRTVAPLFLHYLLRTPLFTGVFKTVSTGVVDSRLRLYPDVFLALPSLLPPISEQRAIVRFLDGVDRLIQRYIRAKKNLIDLLKEEKQAMMNLAVTRGLDPGGRLKPSGVRWLGDLPESWTVKRFKYVATVTSGQVDPRAQAQQYKVLIAPNHIEGGTGRILSEGTADEQGADSGKYEVRRGQIVYSKIRPNLRKAAIAPADCLCSADMYPISVREDEVHPSFMLMVLLSAPFTQYVVDCSLRVAMPKVNREALSNALIWFPSLDEQNRILQFVAHVSGPLEDAIDRMKREIALVREFRSRLITDVVTGKVDVGEAATTLLPAGVPDPNEDFSRFEEDGGDLNSTDEPIVFEEVEA